MTTARKLAYAALLINTLLWGLALPIVKPALSFVTPTQFLYFRYLIAAPLTLLFLPFLKFPHLSLNKFGKILLLEFIGTPILLAILYTGLEKTSGLEASLLGATSPLFTILGGIWFLHERQTKREWQGFALAMFGTAILALEPLFLGNHTLNFSGLTGNFLIILQNLIWAGYLLYAKKLYRGLSKLLVTAFSYWLGLVSFGGYLVFSHSLPPISLLTSNLSLLIPVLYMAIFGSIIALALYLYGQDKIEASEASVFTYLQGVVAIPASFLLLGEKPSWLVALAILVISYGVLRAEQKTHKK